MGVRATNKALKKRTDSEHKTWTKRYAKNPSMKNAAGMAVSSKPVQGTFRAINTPGLVGMTAGAHFGKSVKHHQKGIKRVGKVAGVAGVGLAGAAAGAAAVAVPIARSVTKR